ncbi:MAG: helix-turn-helix transcriptional regulator [Lachnospiraceae bacterium]|nr:helix-turn-helix transcriptional regulator [Lachnospiraceae bacterium]MBQ9935710.1 helix-turn-helix transcriptional regulator [Lachnospiraceae bacterium]
MYDKKSCGERLKKIRTFKSKTQKQVSNETGVSVDTLRKLEQGKRAPSVGVVDLLANYYGVTADYIISGIERQNNDYNEKFSDIPKEKRAKVEEVIDGILELIK